MVNYHNSTPLILVRDPNDPTPNKEQKSSMRISMHDHSPDMTATLSYGGPG